jgi:hypothetical protein
MLPLIPRTYLIIYDQIGPTNLEYHEFVLLGMHECRIQAHHFLQAQGAWDSKLDLPRHSILGPIPCLNSISPEPWSSEPSLCPLGGSIRRG